MSTNKPRGLAQVRHHPTAITTVIEDFEYHQEVSDSETEGWEEEDELKYDDKGGKSLVRSPQITNICLF